MTARLTTATNEALAGKYVEIWSNRYSCGTHTDSSGVAICSGGGLGVPVQVHARFGGDATYEPTEGRF